MKRAAIALAIGLLGGASAIGAQAFDLATADGQREFGWGVRSYHSGFYNEAILTFARVVAQESDSVLARLWLAKSYYAAGLENAALEQYRILENGARASPYVRDRVEKIVSLQNSASLLLPEPQYAVVQEINGRSGNRVLFSRPAGIAVDERINLYVSSFASHEVVELSINGELRRDRWGARGRYAFDRPYAVVVDDESVLVSEFGRDRVVRFGRDGEQEIRFNRAGRNGRLAGPQYLAMDEARNIYVSDWGNQRIVKVNSLGNFIYQFSKRDIPRQPPFSPTGLVYHRGFLYIANAADGTIVVSDANGNYVRTIALGDAGAGDLARIEGLATFDSERLLIATREGIFAYNVRSEELTSIALTAQEKLTSLAVDGNGTIYATDFDRDRILVLSPVDQIYGGLVVHTLGVDASAFPQVTVDVSVRNRFGAPILGLQANNFSLREDEITEEPFLPAENDDIPLAIMLVVPLTERTAQVGEQIQAFVAELLEVLGEDDRVGIVFSGTEAVLRGELGASPARLRNHISEARRQAARVSVADRASGEGRPPSADRVPSDEEAASVASAEDAGGERALDAALRLALSELLTSPAKRAIVYLRDGAAIEGDIGAATTNGNPAAANGSPAATADGSPAVLSASPAATAARRQQLLNAIRANGVSIIELAFGGSDDAGNINDAANVDDAIGNIAANADSAANAAVDAGNAANVDDAIGNFATDSAFSLGSASSSARVLSQFYAASGARRFRYAQSDVSGVIVRRLRATHDGRYRLSYISGSGDEFGQRYIPLSIEAFLYQRSGRDEAGYYTTNAR